MFSTKNVDGAEFDKVKERNFIGYGIHLAALSGYEIKTSSKGSKQVKLKFETPQITEAGFTAHEDAQWGGKVGQAAFGPYLAGEAQQDEFMKKIDLLATRLGISDKVDAIQADTLEAYMEAVVPLLVGKFGYWKLCAREYDKGDGNVGIVNEVARYSFFKPQEHVTGVETSDTGDIIKVNVSDPKTMGGVMTFDKSNKYDFQRLEESSDLPTSSPMVAAGGAPLWKPGS
jgi:hypothetical protein